MTNITSSSNATTTYYAVTGHTSQFANATQAQAAGKYPSLPILYLCFSRELAKPQYFISPWR
jgi:hypothetical protein